MVSSAVDDLWPAVQFRDDPTRRPVADRDRIGEQRRQRVISISYLVLTRMSTPHLATLPCGAGTTISLGRPPFRRCADGFGHTAVAPARLGGRGLSRSVKARASAAGCNCRWLDDRQRRTPPAALRAPLRGRPDRGGNTRVGRSPHVPCRARHQGICARCDSAQCRPQINAHGR